MVIRMRRRDFWFFKSFLPIVKCMVTNVFSATIFCVAKPAPFPWFYVVLPFRITGMYQTWLHFWAGHSKPPLYFKDLEWHIFWINGRCGLMCAYFISSILRLYRIIKIVISRFCSLIVNAHLYYLHITASSIGKSFFTILKY